MLEMTPGARRYLADLRREHGVDDRAGVRLVASGGRVGLTFALAPVAGHRVIDGEVIKLYVPPEVADALGDSIIDVQDQDRPSGLVMRKRATSSSGARPVA